MRYSESDYIRGADLQVDDKLLMVPARLLPTPRVRYANNAVEMPDKGAWNLVRKRFLRPGEIESWAVLSFLQTHEASDIDIQNFVSKLTENLHNLGV